MAFLGHVISTQGVFVGHRKIKKTINWPSPSIILEVRVFLGLVRYYCRFVQGLSYIVCEEPLFRGLLTCPKIETQP